MGSAIIIWLHAEHLKFQLRRGVAKVKDPTTVWLPAILEEFRKGSISQNEVLDLFWKKAENGLTQIEEKAITPREMIDELLGTCGR